MRRAPRAAAPRDIPILPVLVGSVFAVILIALFVVAKVNPRASTPNTRAIANIQCEAMEQTASHYHAHLDILNEGTPVNLPAGIGIRGKCLYWLHTHASDGIIHIEAPKSAATRTFTLGDFMKVWGQPLDSSHVSTLTLRKDQKLVVYVDGKIYDGDPKKIELKPHMLITLEITPPVVDPPPSFTFPEGL